MGTKTFVVFEGVPQGSLYESAYKRQTERVFSWYRITGTGTLWKDCRTDETGTGNYRTAKGGKCLRMGRENEQYTSVRKGDRG